MSTLTGRVFRLPDLGEGLTEAGLVQWLVGVGDVIAVDQAIAEVETAKSVVELPSPFAGVVSALHGEPGDTIAVGAPVIEIADAGTDAADAGTDAADAGTDAADTVESTALENHRTEERAGSGNVLIGYGTSERAGSGRRRRPRAAHRTDALTPSASASPASASPAPASPTPTPTPTPPRRRHRLRAPSPSVRRSCADSLATSASMSDGSPRRGATAR